MRGHTIGKHVKHDVGIGSIKRVVVPISEMGFKCNK